jgi:hypothetical protein
MEAISRAISGADENSGCQVHVNEAPQGTELRSFFINRKSCISHPRTGLMYIGQSARSLAKNYSETFEIVYFPDSTFGNESLECSEKFYLLADLTEHIEGGEIGVMNGENAKCVISGGLLVFEVTYSYTLQKTHAADAMDNLATITGLEE